MQAAVGDRIQIHSRTVGRPQRSGVIVDVRGDHGEPPYLVLFDNGQETLVFPGSDCLVLRDAE